MDHAVIQFSSRHYRFHGLMGSPHFVEKGHFTARQEIRLPVGSQVLFGNCGSRDQSLIRVWATVVARDVPEEPWEKASKLWRSHALPDPKELFLRLQIYQILDHPVRKGVLHAAGIGFAKSGVQKTIIPISESQFRTVLEAAGLAIRYEA